MSKSKRFFHDLDTPEQLLAEFDEKRELCQADSRDQLEDWVISNSNNRLDSFYREKRHQLHQFIQDLLKDCPNLSRAAGWDLMDILTNEVFEAFRNPKEHGDFGLVKRGLQEQITISMARFLLKVLENASEYQRHVQMGFSWKIWERPEKAEAESQPESAGQ